MTRSGVRALAAGMLVAVGLLWLLGAPDEAGSLAGIGGSGPGAAAGLLWIGLVPASVLLVPALAITAAAEGLHAIWVARRPPERSLGLGSRSDPGDT